MMKKFLIFCFVLTSCHVYVTAQDVPLLTNYNDMCVKCLCYAATSCNLTIGCDKGYCGPFKISRIYWIEAENVTLPGDDPVRAGAYEDCSLSYKCAPRIIANYLVKFGRDCNNDGITNCEDYSMIHFNGGYGCSEPLERNEAGRAWARRFRLCAPSNSDP